MKIFAHRGARKNSCENTIPAIEYACTLAVDAIEIDVHKTADNRLVVHHNKDIMYKGMETEIAGLTLSQMETIRLKNKYPVPTLSQVIAAINGRMHLIVEIKSLRTASLVIDELRAHQYLSNVSFTSFEAEELEAVRNILPKAPLVALPGSLPVPFEQYQKTMRPMAIGISMEWVNAALIAEIKQQGSEVYVYTVKTMDEARKLKALGVNGIYCDYPEEILPGIKKEA